MIKVLVVDDSIFMRNTLVRMLSADPEIQVVGQASDGIEALQKIQDLNPDLITLDLEMPRMGGLEVLEKFMPTNPKPVLVVSSLTFEGAEPTLRALELGALDYMAKYTEGSTNFAIAQKDLIEKVKQLAKKAFSMRFLANKLRAKPVQKSFLTGANQGLAGASHTTAAGQTQGQRTAALQGASHIAGQTQGAARFTGTMQGVAAAGKPLSSASSAGVHGAAAGNKTVSSAQAPVLPVGVTVSSDVALTGQATFVSSDEPLPSGKPRRDIVAIGVSTGGPPAVQKVLTALPEEFPACILIAQHMPAAFTGAFAKRLDNLCKIKVKEAQDGDPIINGVAYVCPGGQHISIVAKGALPVIKVSPDPAGELYKPSATILNNSVAMMGYKVVGLTMTGMGSDGCEGTKSLRAKGGYILAQSEDSCVVYGMPRAVVEAKLAHEVVDLDDIAEALMRALYK